MKCNNIDHDLQKLKKRIFKRINDKEDKNLERSLIKETMISVLQGDEKGVREKYDFLCDYAKKTS